MYSNNTNLTLGYHGCDAEVAEKVLSEGASSFISSNNDYDWIGPGVYFWEHNPDRALSFATEQKARGKIRRPAVVGAVLSLGNCLDTLNEGSLDLLKYSYKILETNIQIGKTAMPVNKGGRDRLLRNLDCAVIRTAREYLKGSLEIDTVRGLYTEGGDLYPGSGFYEKTHIQIAVYNLSYIKGVFRVHA